MPCFGYPGARATCQDGTCVPSSIGLLGDPCEDDMNITCRPSSTETSGPLSCMAVTPSFSSEPNMPSSSHTKDVFTPSRPYKICVATDLELGEKCTPDDGNGPVFSICKPEFTCKAQGNEFGSRHGICAKLVSEGSVCDFYGALQCDSGLICAGGTCRKPPSL